MASLTVADTFEPFGVANHELSQLSSAVARLMDALTIARASESSGGIADHTSPRPLSAAATLSNLITPASSKRISSEPGSVTTPVDRTALRSKSAPTGSSSLPTEILILIFEFVFEACVDWNKTNTIDPKHAIVWLEDDHLSPSLFPYSLASVCVRWLHILNSIATYWTRLVITVDSHATSPIAIQTLLRWTGDFPLQLVIARHSGNSGDTDGDEHTRVRTALDILRPHICRTRSLTFNVKYSSSLPALWREQGEARYLSNLTLMSSPSDAGSTPDLPRLPEIHPTRNSDGHFSLLEVGSLAEVTLGGHFFNDVLMFRQQRIQWFRHITVLTVRGYTASGRGGLSLYRFNCMVQTCMFLERLTVENIDFSINESHPSYRFHLEAPIVCLRKLTDEEAVASLVSQSLGTRSKQIVTVADCPFDGFGTRNLFRTRLSSIDLVLERTNASAAAMDTLVCFWNGENLSLIECPGVSGAFLRRVPTETPPDLRRLRIVDCENVSTAGLIALVRSREIQSEMDVLFPGGPDYEPCAALVELHVHGRGPPIYLEQAMWFAEHVDAFSWNTITKDGMRYAWDSSTRELTVLPTDH